MHWPWGQKVKVTWLRKLSRSLVTMAHIPYSATEFNVPFQHKYGYIRDKRSGLESYPTQWRKVSDTLTSTPAAFLFSSHPPICRCASCDRCQRGSTCWYDCLCFLVTSVSVESLSASPGQLLLAVVQLGVTLHWKTKNARLIEAVVISDCYKW